MAPKEEALRLRDLLMNEVLELDIGSLGNRVGGISRSAQHGTVFVRGALPGETVLCRIIKKNKKRLDTELLEVLKSSTARVESFCRHFGECGGCSLQHLLYAEQLHWKHRWVKKALDRALTTYPEPSAVISSPEVKGYRNKVAFDISNGRPGLHRFRGDSMPVEGCPLLNTAGSAALTEYIGKDLSQWKKLTVRASDRTSTSMVEFSGGPVRTRPPMCEGVSVTAWEELHEWRSSPPGSFLTERLAGYDFPVLPGSFFQINTAAADLLVSEVMDVCPTSGSILDLYGGAGTFALPLAGAGMDVTSVELNGAASISGRRAVEMNGVRSINFITADVSSFLDSQIEGGRTWDAVVVDPPRAGLGLRVTRLLRQLNTDLIVMVSCNPFSLASDLGELAANGWQVRTVQPLDMFPQTDHIETITTLTRI